MARLDPVGALSTGAGYLGVVADFDEAAGLGTVAFHGADVNLDRWTLGFHCTQIADGSRSIATGTRVRFQIMPVNLGHFEASAIAPILAPQTGDAPDQV